MPRPHFHGMERKLQLTKEKIWTDEFPSTSKTPKRFRPYSISKRNKDLLREHFEGLIARRPDGLERIQRHIEWCAIFLEMLGKDIDVVSTVSGKESFEFKITKTDIQSLQKKILERFAENKRETIRGCYISVKQFFRWYFRDKFELEPPLFIKDVKLEAQKEDYSKKLLSKGDVIKLLDANIAPNHKACVAGIYFSGARISELGLSNVEDFTFNGTDEVYFTIRYSKTKPRKVLILGLGATILRNWFDLYHPGRQDADFGKQPAFVGITPNQFKKRLTYAAISRMLKKTMKKAKVDAGANAHNLRHSFATSMYMDGYTIPEIAKQLGHSDGSKHTFIYAHFGLDQIHNKMREKRDGGKPIEVTDPFKFEEARLKHEENQTLRTQMVDMQKQMQILSELVKQKLDPFDERVPDLKFRELLEKIQTKVKE